GDHVFLVVEAAGDQGLVGVAFEEGDQHLHAHPRDGDAAVAVASPVGGDAQPAAGLVVAGTVAVPMELHLDPAVFVAVDLFAGRPGDHGGLAAEHLGLGVLQLRAVGDVPRGGEEAVAVALGKGRVRVPLPP